MAIIYFLCCLFLLTPDIYERSRQSIVAMDTASTSEKCIHGEFVIVGGGVAGICCVEELDSIITDKSKIVLITGRGGYIKTVVNPERVGIIDFREFFSWVK